MSFDNIYVITSVCIGVIDCIRLAKLEHDLKNMLEGESFYFMKYMNIIGFHNILFLPSMLIVGVWKGIYELANQ